MPLAAFHDHWRRRHAGIIVRLPGIRHYVQNTPLAGTAAFDAIAESSFDDTQAMKTLARTPQYAEVLADEPNFIDAASMASIITEEHVLKDGPLPAGAVKHLRFVRRDPGVAIDDFFRSLLDEGRRTAAAADVVRYVQCHTRRAVYDSARTPAFDAVEMKWLARRSPHASGMAVAERVVL